MELVNGSLRKQIESCGSLLYVDQIFNYKTTQILTNQNTRSIRELGNEIF